MDFIPLSMLPLLVPLAFMAIHGLKSVHCPDCGESFPQFQDPFKKTRRMWRAGGYLCANCGCETDATGRKVTADTPPAPFPVLQTSLLAVALVIGVGLASCIFFVGRRAPAAPMVAAPAIVIDIPRQAPEMPRVD